MHERLKNKLEALRGDLMCGEFILADAKDADMAWGVPSPGRGWPSGDDTPYRSMPTFLDEVRQVVEQGEVDIMLSSVSAMSRLAHQEQLFESSNVTPAIRANDTTDVWAVRGGSYCEQPSRAFSSCYITEAQYGTLHPELGTKPAVNLGLYSITFNNNLELDLANLEAFHAFRARAAEADFDYFLEVFAPNVDCGIPADQIPAYVNDMICRSLAGVALDERPQFLKIPFLGPAALEELVAYDPSLIVGVLGGSSGTTCDAFTLLSQAQKYGARVALFGRKIKDAEAPLEFIRCLRLIVGEGLAPEEAVRLYHDRLTQAGLAPRRALEDDLQLSETSLSYG
ncbi:hypothetical protein [Algisphaera agarilytica]|uniref:Fructose-bisphosphate aldolase class I n=1 Tax=Algisphaera agarilytica TaxID=1385975 RepID=A0A7X0H2V8_9BACT|nr:hypothetical protein [Algisphaera agarilytica]MBB6428210.1 hypothetical protein [Algisphaera agarilytica]